MRSRDDLFGFYINNNNSIYGVLSQTLDCDISLQAKILYIIYCS